MSLLRAINSTTVQVTEFTTGSSDLVLSIPLTSGETVQFTAETQFFTPRQIATSRSDVLGLPSQSVVEYTANNIPVVKLPIGAVDITTPQFYPISIVSDVYQEIEIDNFFQELTDDLEVPDDELTDLRAQRDAAMQAALALDDLAAASDSGDAAAIEEANQAIDEGLASAIVDVEPDPSTILTPEEADELGALDLVELTDDFGTTDGSEDIINPTPEVLEEDLIQKLPLLPGNRRVRGIDTINQAITLLNSGIQQVEDSTQSGTDEDGNCKFITVAKKKKGFLGVGKRKERKISRSDTQKKLDLIKQDIEAQRASNTTIIGTKSGIVTHIPIVKSSAFGRLTGGLLKAGFLGAIAGIVLAPVTGGASLALTVAGVGTSAASITTGVVGTLAGARTTVPRGRKPMSKAQALKVLELTATQLQKILDKPCN
jgi:Spy/CpxP family protein refolding chaperone